MSAAQKIRILVVDDIAETRDHLAKLIAFEDDLEVVGTAETGAKGLAKAMELRPDIILMDVNMPEGDGIEITELLSAQLPSTVVIMMSVQGESDYLKRSMLAGAREFLVKPFSIDELTASVRQVHARERDKIGRMTAPASPTPVLAAPSGKVVALFSPKGGVGRTTLAVNLAVALGELLPAEGSSGARRICLVDGSLAAGDVAVLIDANPRLGSIDSLYDDDRKGVNLALIDGAITHYRANLDVVLAPPSPELAEHFDAYTTRTLVETLRSRYDVIVVDTAPNYNDVTLALLDVADIILTVVTLEVTAIKNVKNFLGLEDRLGYGDKISLILNRADATLGIRTNEIEQSLARKVEHTIVSDGRTVVSQLNKGVPFVLAERAKDVSEDVFRMARTLLPSKQTVEPDKKDQPKKGRFGFGR